MSQPLPPPSKRILLVGATGYTGSIIAHRLAAAGIPFALAGRNLAKLQALPAATAPSAEVVLLDISDAAALHSVMREFDIVLNCVGPYLLYSQLMVQVAAAAGIIYLDITGEQAFVKESMATHQQQAQKTGATLVHAFAFESCLADLLAARVAQAAESYREISSYYLFENSRPSPGTRLTMQLARFSKTYLFASNDWEEAAPLRRSKEIVCASLPAYTHALFMPYPEVIFFAETYKTQAAGSYILLPAGEALLAAAAPAAASVSREEVLARHERIRAKGPSPAERQNQRFQLLVEAIPESGPARTISLTGTDMYSLTAALVVEAVQEILRQGSLKAGFLLPHQLVSAGFLDKVVKEERLELEEGVAFASETCNPIAL
jgi:short subunit dehydrogenase-like uncharacterized protein